MVTAHPSGRVAARAPAGVLAPARAALIRLVPSAVLLWGALCGLGYLLTTPLHDTAFERRDAWLNRWLAGHRTATLNTVTHWLTYAAETLTVIAIGLVFFIGLRIELGRWRESMFLAAALIGEVTIFVSTTLLIDRNRPPVRHLDGAPPTSSYPSGHMAAAIALYGGLAIIAMRVSARAWLRALAVIAAIVLPACVGFARLYRGMHFPTDVLGGVVLGLVWLTVAWVVLLRSHPRDA
jgi:membrane-associated phospholipid phosphatase